MILAWQMYNRQIAETNRQVAHGRPDVDNPGTLRNSFFRNNDFHEQQVANQVLIHSPYIVCGPVAGKPSGSSSAYKKTTKARMFFLAHVGESMDNLELVQDQTFSVMTEWISKYLHDFLTTGMCGPFMRLDITHMFWQQVGPISQWEYGWQLDMDFQDKGDNFHYDSSKWFE